MYEDFRIFSSIVAAIVLESAPFLLLGSLVGAAFEVFVSRDWLAGKVPRSTAGRICMGLAAGMVLPSCECGIVPIVRRLLMKGVPPQMAIPYMMAGPVINPIVLVSTYVAFQDSLPMLFWRVFMVAVPAVVMGLALGRAGASDLLLGGGAVLKSVPDHGHAHGLSCGCGHASGPRWLALLAHAGRDFLQMGKFLIFGAVAAGLFKTFAPQGVLSLFEGSMVASVGGMMLLAMLLSVCSEADAFVAAGFSTFPALAQISFVAIGPMVDLKLVAMFLAVFKRRVVLALVLVPTVLVFFLCVLAGMLGGDWGMLP